MWLNENLTWRDRVIDEFQTFFKKENIIITEIDTCLNRYSVTMLLTNELLRLGDLEKINDLNIKKIHIYLVIEFRTSHSIYNLALLFVMMWFSILSNQSLSNNVQLFVKHTI